MVGTWSKIAAGGSMKVSAFSSSPFEDSADLPLKKPHPVETATVEISSNKRPQVQSLPKRVIDMVLQFNVRFQLR